MARTIPRSETSCCANIRRGSAVALALLAVVAALLACSTDSASAPEEPNELESVAGDRQSGIAGTTVDSPLVVRVHTASGQPVARVGVQWAASGGGVVVPAVTETDAWGMARTTWQLDPQQIGTQTVTVSAAGARGPVSFTADARPAGPLPLPLPTPGPPLPGGPLTSLALITYDGSGQVVHPDVATTPSSWSAEAHWLVITPYPYGNASYENPSIFVGDDATHWQLPATATNPVVRPTEGYLSDPDQLWVPESGELWLYYRQVVGAENLVLLTRSRDGVRWSSPVTVVRVPNHQAISPAVVRRGSRDWLMWTVNGGSDGCRGTRASLDLRHSTDGVNWSAPSTVALDQPGFFPWHVDVEWVESRHEFWALYNAKVAGSCNTPALYLATSPDGVTWTTYPSPVLARTLATPFSDVVYRSSFEYDAASDAITFWYSGARFDGTGFAWSAAVQRRDRAELFAQIQTPVVASMSTVPAPRSTVPLLDNETAP